MTDHSTSLAEALHPRRTALVMHDMQNDFCTEGGKIYRNAAKHPETIAAVVKELTVLSRAARASGAKVIYFQQMHLPHAADIPAAHVHHLVSSGLAATADDVACIRGSWGHQIIDELKPGDTDIVVEKAAFNDFTNSIADKVLRVQGIETVLLTGVSSHAGVLGTVFGLLDLGYRFFIPRECVAGYMPELHEAAMKIMGPHVIHTAEIIAAWNQVGGTPR
jgi:biuret amidohydrolase